MKQTTPLPTGLDSESQPVEPTPRPWKARLIRWNPGEPVLGFAIQSADHDYNVSKHGLSIASAGAAEPSVSAQAVYGADVLEANARLIVKAVNAHDQLVAAVNLLAYLRDSGRVDMDADEVPVLEVALTALIETEGA